MRSLGVSLGKREPLGRARLGEIVSERLGEWISERQLKPGDRLPSEPELAAHFGVARTVIREALSKLKTLGIIEVFQGKGAFVASLPVELLFMRVRRLGANYLNENHLWEVRELLELRAIELASDLRTRDDLIALEAALQDPEATATVENERFHHALAHASQNPLLEQLIAELVKLGTPFLVQWHADDKSRASKMHADHKAMLEAVQARDGAKARMLMQTHLRNAVAHDAVSNDKDKDEVQPNSSREKVVY
jgi:GntR family transcriptional regulator, transcriptional repressor for pyruvate dehydrogenase complex